jgi:hydroxyacylglutathione hydrolase
VGIPESLHKDTMTPEIKTIRLLLPLKLGSVNCYLIETNTGFILIDTGSSNKRTDLEKELKHASCKPGNLTLIILTHGDFDHTGNAAYLRKAFCAKIAMHSGDLGMIEHGNMFFNRKKGNIFLKIITRIFFKFDTSKRCTPDVYVDDGYDFSEYGFNAKVLHLPGHSHGSIGILTANGNLFCGDLLENITNPSQGSIIDDVTEANASVEKLNKLKINTVYPGHGKPFQMSSYK